MNNTFDTRTVVVASNAFHAFTGGEEANIGELRYAIEMAADFFYGKLEDIKGFKVIIRKPELADVNLPDDFDREESEKIIAIAWDMYQDAFTSFIIPAESAK